MKKRELEARVMQLEMLLEATHEALTEARAREHKRMMREIADNRAIAEKSRVGVAANAVTDPQGEV